MSSYQKINPTTSRPGIKLNLRDLAAVRQIQAKNRIGRSPEVKLYLKDLAAVRQIQAKTRTPRDPAIKLNLRDLAVLRKNQAKDLDTTMGEAGVITPAPSSLSDDKALMDIDITPTHSSPSDDKDLMDIDIKTHSSLSDDKDLMDIDVTPTHSSLSDDKAVMDIDPPQEKLPNGSGNSNLETATPGPMVDHDDFSIGEPALPLSEADITYNEDSVQRAVLLWVKANSLQGTVSTNVATSETQSLALSEPLTRTNLNFGAAVNKTASTKLATHETQSLPFPEESTTTTTTTNFNLGVTFDRTTEGSNSPTTGMTSSLASTPSPPGTYISPYGPGKPFPTKITKPAKPRKPKPAKEPSALDMQKYQEYLQKANRLMMPDEKPYYEWQQKPDRMDIVHVPGHHLELDKFGRIVSEQLYEQDFGVGMHELSVACRNHIMGGVDVAFKHLGIKLEGTETSHLKLMCKRGY
jgi:hypothetical protein